MGFKPLDSGLSSGKWRLDVGRATLGECHMRLISLLSWVTSVKKIQVLRHENVPLKHYTFSRTLKKVRGTIGCNMTQLSCAFLLQTRGLKRIFPCAFAPMSSKCFPHKFKQFILEKDFVE